MILIIPLGILLALEIYHLARRKGWDFPLFFFGGALLFGIIRGNVVGLISLVYGMPRPYGFSQPGLRLGFTSLVEPFGWAFALYGSWFLAEGILRKVKAWRGEVLPVAFLATLIMGAFSYAVEATATPMGWWHWRIMDVGDLFFYAVPVVGIMDWASVGPDFLLPFLLLQLPQVKKSRWRFALPLIFVVHMVTHLIFLKVNGFGALYEVYHYMSIWVLGAAALFFGGKLKIQGTRTQLCGAPRDRLDVLPFISVAGMLAIALYATAGVSGDGVLLFSLAPLAAALLLAAPGVPLLPVAALLAAGTLLDLKAAPTLLVAACPVVYRFFNPHRRAKLLIALAVALAAAGCAAYFPWSHWRFTTMERLQAMRHRAEPEVVAAEGGELQRRLKSYRLTCKFAGGEGALRYLFDAAWKARDREAFDYAVSEFSTFGYAKVDPDRLWDAESKSAFRNMLDRARAARD